LRRRTFSTRSGTPTWHPTASKTFGGTDDSGCSLRTGTPLRQIVRSRVHWRWRTLPRLALLRRNRGIDVFEQPVRTLVLVLLKLGWTQHAGGRPIYFPSILDRGRAAAWRCPRRAAAWHNDSSFRSPSSWLRCCRDCRDLAYSAERVLECQKYLDRRERSRRTARRHCPNGTRWQIYNGSGNVDVGI